MPAVESIFLTIRLPNATTWFYFSALLTLPLFFKFWRLLSMRNLDLLTLFLFMPGLLLLTEGTDRWGFVWLLGASGYFLARCIFDLGLARRPALAPNLSLGGLFWFVGTLFVSLLTVPLAPKESAETPPLPLDKAVPPLGEKFASQQYSGPDAGPWVERSLALLCHLAIVAGLILIGWKHFDDIVAGASAAVVYLLLPYTFLMLPHSPLETALKAGRWD